MKGASFWKPSRDRNPCSLLFAVALGLSLSLFESCRIHAIFWASNFRFFPSFRPRIQFNPDHGKFPVWRRDVYREVSSSDLSRTRDEHVNKRALSPFTTPILVTPFWRSGEARPRISGSAPFFSQTPEPRKSKRDYREMKSQPGLSPPPSNYSVTVRWFHSNRWNGVALSWLKPITLAWGNLRGICKARWRTWGESFEWVAIKNP